MSQYTRDKIKDFVNAHKDDIHNAIVDTSLFFPFVVAQLTVESDWETSDATRILNNWGGIKDFSGNGVMMDTTEIVGGRRVSVKQPFHKYSSFRDFMDGYVSLMLSSKYRNAITNAQTPKEQALAVAAAGYTTMTPNGYLSSGIGDRIKATQDQFPLLGRISSTNSNIQNVEPNFMDKIIQTFSLY